MDPDFRKDNDSSWDGFAFEVTIFINVHIKNITSLLLQKLLSLNGTNRKDDNDFGQPSHGKTISIG